MLKVSNFADNVVINDKAKKYIKELLTKPIILPEVNKVVIECEKEKIRLQNVLISLMRQEARALEDKNDFE